MSSTTPELAQLDLLAQVDSVIDGLSQWAADDSPWDPMNHCRALVKRLLPRIQSLRIRLEAPLVVATFGGTGTGKSTLVNALVGRECARTGRERPTTVRPLLLAHPETELGTLGFPIDEFDVARVDAPLLRDLVVIDCPDPDTSEAASGGSNLERLHRLLPYCDVLIYASTQQKYRSARVADELGSAAAGCRLLFVQTHADLDEDIREDWRRHLAAHYEVPDVFFVDSLHGLKEQLAGERATGDLARLQHVLSTQLSAAHHLQIRRANLVTLAAAALERCVAHLRDNEPALERLETAREEQQTRLLRAMSEHLGRELAQSSQLWERRLLGSVAQLWGFSPFSSVLRAYNALGGLIASVTLLRARSSAQVALVGAIQGVRWLRARQQEYASENRLQRLAVHSTDDNVLREAQLLISGYVKSARLDPGLVGANTLQNLRIQADDVEAQFIEDAGRRIDQAIDDLVAENTGRWTRAAYEALFAIYPLFVFYRAGKNFFYDTLFYGADYVTTSFWLSAGLFLVLWSWLVVALFSRRLRRRLGVRIDELGRALAERKLSGGIFPALDEACRRIHLQTARLESIASSLVGLEGTIDVGALGAARLPPRSAVTAGSS